MIEVRRMIESDIREIWSWRNDLTTRNNSISSDVITWAVHSRWFYSALEDKNSLSFVGLVGADKVGLCRFTLIGNVAEVSINLNPAFRGKRLASPLLKYSIAEYCKSELNVNFSATIKHSNHSSIACFESVGFTLSDSDEHYVYMTK
jgi:RimJ/RimL family protein N-acetyltransferase